MEQGVDSDGLTVVCRISHLISISTQFYSLYYAIVRLKEKGQTTRIYIYPVYSAATLQTVKHKCTLGLKKTTVKPIWLFAGLGRWIVTTIFKPKQCL